MRKIVVLWLLIVTIISTSCASNLSTIGISNNIISYDVEKLNQFLERHWAPQGGIEYFRDDAIGLYNSYHAYKTFDLLSIEVKLTSSATQVVDTLMLSSLHNKNINDILYLLLINEKTERTSIPSWRKELSTFIHDVIEQAIVENDIATLYRLLQIASYSETFTTSLYDKDRIILFLEENLRKNIVQITPMNINETNTIIEIYSLLDISMKSEYKIQLYDQSREYLLNNPIENIDNFAILYDLYNLTRLTALFNEINGEIWLCQIEQFHDVSGLYSMSASEQLNMLPTAWAVEIYNETGVSFPYTQALKTTLDRYTCFNGFIVHLLYPGISIFSTYGVEKIIEITGGKNSLYTYMDEIDFKQLSGGETILYASIAYKSGNLALHKNIMKYIEDKFESINANNANVPIGMLFF